MQVIKVDNARHIVITPEIQVSFPQLFKAKAYQDKKDAKKEFKVDLIFQNEGDLKLPGILKGNQTTPSLKKAILNAKIDQWGPDKKKWPKFKNDPIRIGNDNRRKDTDEIYQGYEDKLYITAKSGETYPPKILLPNKKIATEADIHGGVYAKAAILVRPFEYAGFGITLRLLSLIRTNRTPENFDSLAKDYFDAEEELEENFEDEDLDL